MAAGKDGGESKDGAKWAGQNSEGGLHDHILNRPWQTSEPLHLLYLILQYWSIVTFAVLTAALVGVDIGCHQFGQADRVDGFLPRPPKVQSFGTLIYFVCGCHAVMGSGVRRTHPTTRPTPSSAYFSQHQCYVQEFLVPIVKRWQAWHVIRHNKQERLFLMHGTQRSGHLDPSSIIDVASMRGSRQQLPAPAARFILTGSTRRTNS